AQASEAAAREEGSSSRRRRRGSRSGDRSSERGERSQREQLASPAEIPAGVSPAEPAPLAAPDAAPAEVVAPASAPAPVAVSAPIAAASPEAAPAAPAPLPVKAPEAPPAAPAGVTAKPEDILKTLGGDADLSQVETRSAAPEQAQAEVQAADSRRSRRRRPQVAAPEQMELMQVETSVPVSAPDMAEESAPRTHGPGRRRRYNNPATANEPLVQVETRQ
ncbi:MAG: hypothetical protein AB1591_11575, partial [Pseudomonadota bacterium]